MQAFQIYQPAEAAAVPVGMCLRLCGCLDTVAVVFLF